MCHVYISIQNNYKIFYIMVTMHVGGKHAPTKIVAIKYSSNMTAMMICMFHNIIPVYNNIGIGKVSTREIT